MSNGVKMFVRIKNIKSSNGKLLPYAYLCETDWNKGKVKQKVVKYLGRVDLEHIDLDKLVFDKCALCKSVLDLTMDHKIPLTKGGTNALENIQILCRRCNQKKGTT